jgi:hypothetical protein
VAVVVVAAVVGWAHPSGATTSEIVSHEQTDNEATHDCLLINLNSITKPATSQPGTCVVKNDQSHWLIHSLTHSLTHSLHLRPLPQEG